MASAGPCSKAVWKRWSGLTEPGGDDRHGTQNCQMAGQGAPGRPKSIWQRINETVPTWIQVLCAVVGVTLAVLTYLAATRSTSPSSAGGGPLVVQDAYQGGVWARTQPQAGSLPPQSVHPEDGVKWIPNKTTEVPICARKAAPYPVTNDGNRQTWYWWAELRDHSWMPMAAFQETSTDGPYSLRAC